MKSLLNLGCGSRFHPAWVNVDFDARDASVLSHDLRRGVPFPDEQFEVVYHSHLLEHFPRPEARAFLRETYRVLKPGGTTRIAVPDLEKIAQVYLQAVEEAARGDEQWRRRYEWIILEVLDQTVRERPGGEMGDYLRRTEMSEKAFVLQRLGVSAQEIMEAAEQVRSNSSATAEGAKASSLSQRLQRLRRAPAYLRESLVRALLGAEYESLQLGRFRRSGDPHLWMYDRYSLAELLRDAGFRDPQPMGAAESRIPGWADYHLDTEPDGTIYKPDSFYMEARK
ncbi:MAG TPA: methyltransferase domain-containing protein [Pyrinomonadaceae bacterium]|jgi:predicted SAM-dependent methyltransferase